MREQTNERRVWKNDQPAERTREQRNRRTSLNERVRKDQTREKVSKNYSEQENGRPNNGGNARRKEREKLETNVTNLFFPRENERTRPTQRTGQGNMRGQRVAFYFVQIIVLHLPSRTLLQIANSPYTRCKAPKQCQIPNQTRFRYLD